MNIYFACSITGGREFEPIYRTITSAMIADGHEVPTAHLAETGIKILEGQVSPREVYERDVAWIRACDALVAEVSTPSHGVGYEVSYALSLQKPVLCVYREGQPVSKMLSGNSQPTILVKSYRNAEEAIDLIRVFLRGKIEL
jgi:nucleoside 2-deoxyribosyltransferase